jgi:glyoxalase family protein
LASDEPGHRFVGVKLEGIHHITAITGDAPRNLDFYTRLLGLRMVKKTVNFDAPDVYHLYYGDELGNPGSVLTFFEFPGAVPGRAGAGMVHRVVWRVADHAALDFWADRLGGEDIAVERGERTLRFRDPEGLELELAVSDAGEPSLAAQSPEVPAEHALLGFDGVHAFSLRPEASAPLLGETLGFEHDGDGWRLRGDERSARLTYDAAPAERGIQGAGTVHHVAWASRDEDHEAWRERAAQAGAHVTPVIDRDYFHSIYFREPSGVLFEIATQSPGFTVDEPAEHLGESLKLPKQHEHLRPKLEQALTPLETPRAASR